MVIPLRLCYTAFMAEQSNLNVQEAIEQIEYGIELGPEVRYIIEFVKSSQRGIIR